MRTKLCACILMVGTAGKLICLSRASLISKAFRGYVQAHIAMRVKAAVQADLLAPRWHRLMKRLDVSPKEASSLSAMKIPASGSRTHLHFLDLLHR